MRGELGVKVGAGMNVKGEVAVMGVSGNETTGCVGPEDKTRSCAQYNVVRY